MLPTGPGAGLAGLVWHLNTVRSTGGWRAKHGDDAGCMDDRSVTFFIAWQDTFLVLVESRIVVRENWCDGRASDVYQLVQYGVKVRGTLH